MTKATFMDKDVFHENRRAEGIDRDSELLLKLSDNSSLCCLP